MAFSAIRNVDPNLGLDCAEGIEVRGLSEWAQHVPAVRVTFSEEYGNTA